MNDNDNIKKEPQMAITPEVAHGVYSNISLITHSNTEFIIDFARMLPGLIRPEVASRIILTPENCKRLLFALQDNINIYESHFGPIRVDMPVKQTISPFGNDKGEA
ncbi:MAG: DUF3467 domain-containing protein [Prevotella sp.]|nr:DUF3467 domain-containing protein [Prevotella sp.]MBR1518026.1 DUF3467 domain-containing protein [Prevotella sp.]